MTKVTGTTKKKLAVAGLGSVGIVVIILIVFNLISVRVFGRVDLTEGRIYSLSESTKRMVQGLDDRITIRCYFSEEIPQPYNAYRRYIKDQLDEYKAYAGGNLNYVFVDPVKAGKEQEARSYGIPAVPMQTLARDKMEIKQVFMGMVILFEDKTEVIPFIQNVNTLEYEVTRAIRKLTSDEIPVVGFATGHGELTLDAELSYINQVLSEEYQLRTINLRTMNSIPPEIQTLYIVGPRQPFSEWELYLLDQFLMRGGKVGLLIDRIDADVQQGTARPLDPGFGPFLGHFGVGLNQGMVIDAQNAQIAVTQQQGPFRFQSLREYPPFPRATRLSKENLIVKDLEAINFIFTVSLDTTRFKRDQLDYEILAWTSERSGIQNPPFDINPLRTWVRTDFAAAPQPLGVAITGRFNSYFAGKPKPAMDTLVTDQLTPVVETRLDEGDQGRLVVWADADFVSDQVLRDQANLIMFQNMTDWLSQDQGLIAIRSKEVTARPLKPVEDATRTWVKYLNIFLMPVLVIVFGVARWQIRKQNRRRQVL